MSFFKEIEDIAPYLLSINNFGSKYYSIDVKSPSDWVIPNEFNDNNITKFDVDGAIGIRFICEFKEEDVEKLLLKVRDFIRINEERVRKDVLYAKTIELLKEVFDKNSLDKLKKLKFYFDNGKKTDLGASNGRTKEVRKGGDGVNQDIRDGEETIRETIDNNE